MAQDADDQPQTQQNDILDVTISFKNDSQCQFFDIELSFLAVASVALTNRTRAFAQLTPSWRSWSIKMRIMELMPTCSSKALFAFDFFFPSRC